MRKRMLVAFLALTALVLVALEVPLAISLARRERDARATTAQRDATALAALSEEAIEHPASHDLAGLVARYARHTDLRVAVVGRDGQSLAAVPPGQGPDAGSFAAGIGAALHGRPSAGQAVSEDGAVGYAITPVGTDAAIGGAVLVTYPMAPVERAVHGIWGALGLLGAFVLALAAMIGVAVARSVTRPLSGLERAAAALGHGDLQARITDTGAGAPAELRSLADTFNTMAARLSELVDSQRRFVADASHQLRSPLTALRLRLEGIDAEDPATAADLEAALGEVHRLSRIVDGLLALARAEGAPSRLERVVVDVATVAEERRAAWGPLADERGVHLGVEAPADGAVDAHVLAGSLEQILDNLLANAVDVSRPGGRVTIAVHPTSGGVEVRVIDDGPGMAADERAHAFDRFWHGRSNGSTGGTGLGLAIVRQLAAANGGTVELDDHAGGGLEVVLRLPVRS